MILSSLFQQGRLLSECSTFGIGGPAKYFIEIKEIETMQRTIRICHENKLPYFILGKGSNCLFDDRGFNGVIIANRIDFIQRPAEDLFYVGAGYSFSLLGSQTARQGWSGLEFASGIPGSVGGAVYMNAGANGCETCDSLLSVEFITNTGEKISLMRNDIEFKYRYSSFQDRQGAIIAATFQLTPSTTAREKQLEIISYRKKTQPYSAKSAGCVFRNPIGGHAGALIDQAGLKGTSIGEAQVSDIHANFVINKGKATAQEVSNLIEHIKQKVKTTTGIELESEVRCIPYDPSMVEQNL